MDSKDYGSTNDNTGHDSVVMDTNPVSLNEIDVVAAPDGLYARNQHPDFNNASSINGMC